MPTLKSRFHGTTSAFCSVTVEEIVRGETREEKMFVVESLDQESRREAERKGREERKQRQNRPLSCRSWSYVFLLLRHHCLLQPRSNFLAHFYFVTTSISIVQPIRPFVPLRGYTGQYFDAAPSNDQLFFSSFQVNRATRYLIHRCISYFQLLCSQFLFVR